MWEWFLQPAYDDLAHKKIKKTKKNAHSSHISNNITQNKPAHSLSIDQPKNFKSNTLQ